MKNYQQQAQFDQTRFDTRRHFLKQCGSGLGGLCLLCWVAAMLAGRRSRLQEIHYYQNNRTLRPK